MAMHDVHTYICATILWLGRGGKGSSLGHKKRSVGCKLETINSLGHSVWHATRRKLFPSHLLVYIVISPAQFQPPCLDGDLARLPHDPGQLRDTGPTTLNPFPRAHPGRVCDAAARQAPLRAGVVRAQARRNTRAAAGRIGVSDDAESRHKRAVSGAGGSLRSCKHVRRVMLHLGG